MSKVSLSVAGEEAWRLAEGGRPLSRSPGLYAGQQNPAFLVGTLPVCKAVRSAADTKLLRRHHLEQAFVAQGNGANQLEATGLTLVPLKKS